MLLKAKNNRIRSLRCIFSSLHTLFVLTIYNYSLNFIECKRHEINVESISAIELSNLFGPIDWLTILFYPYWTLMNITFVFILFGWMYLNYAFIHWGAFYTLSLCLLTRMIIIIKSMVNFINWLL